jgi:hypothetical protein
VWEPRLSEARAVTLTASSEVTRSRTLVFTGVAVAAGVAALLVAIGVPVVRRRRRSRRTAPRGKHAAAGSDR